MIKRNEQFARLSGSYLFPEIFRRKQEFAKKFPEIDLINLGVGDTTEPIPPHITTGLIEASRKLGTRSGYTGYGPEQGNPELRKKIASVLYEGRVKPEEVFVSDGAKCDIGRLQLLFGSGASIAVQDPVYPVYVEGSILHGVRSIHYMPCLPENGFFPDLNNTPKTDLIYFCSPNNPTGAVATRAQLTELVAFAKKNRSIVIFDSAYALFIKDKNLPRSIYEIEGARQVAIEVSSFSKIAGFTGVRLGWTVIPEELRFEDGGLVKADWNRLMTTVFNGASNIAQQGGIATLGEMGMQEIHGLVHYYMENADLLKKALEAREFEVYGGNNAPYLWVRFPERKSWEVFEELMHNLHIVGTPGAGFGPSGDEFIRFSAFGLRETILKAVKQFHEHARL